MNHFLKIISGALISVIFLSSCARSAAVKEYFLSDIGRIHSSVSKGHKILLVASPSAVAAFQTKDMHYIQQPYRLSQFARHAWISPPAEMIGTLLAQRIAQMGYFHAVVSPPYIGLVDFRLDTRLIALYQKFEGLRSVVVLEVQADLVDVSRDSRLLKSQRFSAQVQTPDNTPYGGVIAANEAVKNILDQLVLFVSACRNLPEYRVYELPKPKNMRN